MILFNHSKICNKRLIILIKMIKLHNRQELHLKRLIKNKKVLDMLCLNIKILWFNFCKDNKYK
jgi:hypothetical protein